MQVLRSDLASSAAQSLYHWASRQASQVSASDEDLALSLEEGDEIDQERQVTYEICLEGSVALSISRSYLATVYFEDGSPVRDLLQGAECRLCRRSSTGFRSEESGGHTNRYEAEFNMPANSPSSCDHIRLGINVCKYYNEGACGWDEGLDVNCYVDGKEILNLRRDGSEAEYDTQSVNRGLLHQLTAQLLVPASEWMTVLTMLWQILCAPLLACSRWDEEKPRLGLGLPHRKDEPLVFHTIGLMFEKLAESVSGTSVGSTISSQSRREATATTRFLSSVLEK